MIITRRYKRLLRKSLNIAYWFAFTILILSGTVVVLSTFNTPLSVKFLTVQSGSMEPNIKMGSVVVVKPISDYKVNNIISFTPPDEKNLNVTHRIIGIEYLEGGQKQFITKGDANEDADSEKLPESAITGKAIFSIPFLGYLITFIRKPAGTILLIIIPATLFVVSELNEIKKEIIVIRRKKALS